MYRSINAQGEGGFHCQLHIHTMSHYSGEWDAQVMMLEAFVAAIEDKPEDVTTALKDQAELLHKLMKLAQWTATPTKSSHVLQLFEVCMALCADASFFKDLRESETDETKLASDEGRCRTLAKLQKSFRVLDSLDTNDFVKGTFTDLFGPGPCDNISSWTSSFQAAVETQLDVIKTQCQAAVATQTQKVQAELEKFTDDSARSVAEGVKKEADKLAAELSQSRMLTSLIGISEEEVPELAAGQEASQAARDRSLTWGFVTLLNRKFIADPLKGKSDRARLKSLYEDNVKGQKLILTEDATVQHRECTQ